MKDAGIDASAITAKVKSVLKKEVVM